MPTQTGNNAVMNEAQDVGSYEVALKRAQQQPTPELAAPFYLTAAQALTADEQYQQAFDILQSHVVGIDFAGQFDGLLLVAQTAVALDQSNVALDALKQAERMPIAERPQYHIALLNTRADVMGALDNWTRAVRDRSNLSLILPKAQQLENQQKLWLAIQNLTDNEVSDLQQSDLPLIRGWLNISNILRRQDLTVEQQVSAYERWRSDNPSHPAAINAPLDFQVMSTLKEQEPNSIAVLLPMSKELKPASEAILNGMLKSYYANAESQRPALHVIDTDQYTDFADAYQAALDSDAETIVGPLRKQNVARLGNLVEDVPTIALNQLETNRVVDNLYHFSLNVRDDIRELMSFAKQEGASNAAVLALQTTWAARQSDQFNFIAQEQELPVLTTLSYEDTPNGRQQTVKKLLQVDESEARIQQIRRWTKQSVESTPRARQDLDYVYYIGKLDDAKQIRPLLDFYFAEDIPMLAAPTIHDRTPSPNTKEEDIERIVFSEIPAITNADQEQTNTPFLLQRLDAMGNDSYLIAKRLMLFTHVQSAKVSAKTGILTLDGDGIFNRRPNIVTYKQGVLIDAKEDYFKHQEN
ncbi:penicillin-binding protein activator [Marinomonas ostreistagni]|uniref:penicillin-binding protein activator n=1 Tax=Marinomonas ostreistagni TaxID=359209 RepID=UPI00194E556B|nr:penicillin-binding protein activator [Marinomonas ostreistagni]MBM6549880.1 penicillin-binding protein activator [Marinomonas ostreistagni]